MRGRVAAVLLLIQSATALPADVDWFPDDCPEAAPTRPEEPTPTLLRVLRHPGDRGFDAVMLRLPDGHLAAPRDFFVQLGVSATLPDSTRVQGDYFDLDRFPEIDYAVNTCEQTLSVDAARLKARRTVSLRHGLMPIDDEPAARGAGGFAQVDAQYVDTGRDETFSALTTAGLFAGDWQLQSGALFGEHDSVRLDTFWIRPQPDQLTVLRIGDGITRADATGFARRFGGVQWGTDFALQPGLVTFPLPATRGLATLPSSVDVYINDVLRGRTQVQAGPFEVTDISGITGEGRVRLVVTDLLGRSQVLEYDIYTAPQLLRRGLSEYSIAVGAARRNYGLRSNDYGAGFVSALYRTGLDDHLTIDTHVEAGDDRYIASAGYTVMISDVATVQASLAQAAGDSSGGQMRVAAEHIGRIWSFRGQWQRTSAGFLRVDEPQPPSLRRSLVGVSWRERRAGTVSVNWIDDLGVDSRVRSLALGYTPPELWGWYLGISARYDLQDSDGHSLFALVSRSLGTRTHVSASAQVRRSGTTVGAAVSRHARGPLGWQSRAGLSQGEFRRVYAGAAFTDPRAGINAEVEDFEGEQAYRVGVRTGAVALGRDWFWTRPLTGPFAVVDTGPANDVRVFRDNQFVGRTDRRGLLLVPDLRGYEPNLVSVSDDSFAVDARVDRFGAQLTPLGFGGTRIDFRPRSEVSRRVRLRRDDGTSPPAGADVRVEPGGEESFVGFGGDTIVTAVPGRHRLHVRWWPDGACAADLALDADARLADPIVDLRCTASPALSPYDSGRRP